MTAKLNESSGQLNNPNSPGLKILKVAVVVMGIMIILGVVALVATVVKRANPKSDKPTVEAVAERNGFGDIDLAVPPGARVADMTVGERHLVLRLEQADAADQILILDLATGAVLGTLSLRPGDR